MAQSRSLPDPETLRLLLLRAGVGANGTIGPVPATASPTERIGIPVREPDDFSDVLSREPEPAPKDTSLPTIAEMSESDLLSSVFGPDMAAMPTEERLGAFVQWLMGGTGAFAAFVADTDGLPLTNRNAPESYLAAIGPLGRAQETIARFVPSPHAGSSTVELDHQNVLQVIWSDTAAGRLAVGLVLSGALDAAMVRRIRRITRMSMSPRGDM